MAIYKIFPEKSATLYSYYPTLNTGLDEILELGTYLTKEGTNEVSRPIIKFSQSDIVDIIDNKISGAAYDVYLQLSLANASQLPLDYTIHCHALTDDWNVGTGKLSNFPITTNGVSWEYTTELSGSVWSIGISGRTGSYSGSNVGGGAWWLNYDITQSFTHNYSKDIKINIFDIVNGWYINDIDNNGVILKNNNNIEFTTASAFNLKYFSGNTNTIYPPCLEFRWNDSSYNTGSLSLASANSVITIGNNQGTYQQESIQRFKINVRDRFPARAFQTTSVYLNNKALPEESYYSIKDLDTEEIVVDYDTTYTKISCDPTGNYFDVYMSGLEPERYYKLLIKTTISGSTTVFDDNYFFKVIR